MKIGYPCINLSLNCTSSKTVRLVNFSEDKFYDLVRQNLTCLEEILKFNVRHNIYFFRISSGIIPFGSHPITADIKWENNLYKILRHIGDFIKKNKIRINMHPGQYSVINSNNSIVKDNAIRDIAYHVKFLDILGLDSTNKVQIHVGGLYNDKEKSIERFINTYNGLSTEIKKRLTLENDDKSFNTQDCIEISKKTNIPIVFDTLHETINKSQKDFWDMVMETFSTWGFNDGLPIVDFSTQKPGGKIGSHDSNLDGKAFQDFIRKLGGKDCDIMLELKNKEKNAIAANKLLDLMV
jgi:UV DNA damage endonuclease